MTGALCCCLAAFRETERCFGGPLPLECRVYRGPGLGQVSDRPSIPARSEPLPFVVWASFRFALARCEIALAPTDARY
jgi:hypothetical protein